LPSSFVECFLFPMKRVFYRGSTKSMHEWGAARAAATLLLWQPSI
jgi:hypothetical protein